MLSAFMRAKSSAFRRRSRSISEMYGLRTIVLTICICAPIDAQLLVGRRNAHDLRRARRQIFHHRAARAAQQNRSQALAQPLEILVAEDFAFLVRDAMAVEEPERRTESPVVDELHDREEIVEPILERRAGEHEREWRAQALHGLGRLRLPVLDALALVQNDQVPLCALDRQDVTQHLLVVADGEEAPVLVLRGALFGAAEHDLTVAFREAQDLAAPLGLDRRGAHDQDFADVRLPREQLGHADTLNRLAESHVIGQDRAPGAGGEGDAVQLVGQQLHLQQRLAQRVRFRIAPDVGDRGGDALLQEPGLNVLLGIGIDRHGEAVRLESPDAFEQVREIGDGPVSDRAHDRSWPSSSSRFGSSMRNSSSVP